MKLLLRIYLYIIRNYFYIANRIRLYFHNVKFTSVKINGKLYIKNNGEINLGRNIYINSNISSNMLGGSSFSALVSGTNGVIQIGNNVGISNSSITAHKRIVIEDGVTIGNACKIFDSDFHQIDSRHKSLDKLENINNKEILIKKNVFLGTGVVVLKGVTIGENSVIGAYSVVTKSIPDNEVWGGNPAKRIKTLNKDNELK